MGTQTPFIASRNEARSRPAIVRPAAVGDGAEIERLSQLEGRRIDGELLVAEVEGELRAAIALEGGASIADPFRPTADLVAMLERSREHLRGDRGSGLRRQLASLRRIRHSSRAHASPADAC